MIHPNHFLYVSSIDISASRGSSVNEREFIIEMARLFKDRIHFIVPQPQYDIDGIDRKKFTFSQPHFSHHPIYLWKHKLSQLLSVLRIYRSRRIDLIIFRMGVLPLEQYLIARMTRVPYVLKTLGDSIGDALINRGGFLGKLLVPLNEYLFTRLMAKATAMDVCTETLRQSYLERTKIDPSKLLCIENATNTVRFQPMDKLQSRLKYKLEGFNPILGYVGGEAWERGGQQMIELAPHLLRQFPNLGILVVGGGSKMNILHNLADELGVKEHCIFTGIVPYDEVPYYINSFDVGISLDRPDRLAAIGNSSQKVRQYIACGIPVISVAGGNQFIESQQLGSLVDPTDKNQILNEVIKWLSMSVDQQRTFAEKASSFAKNELSIEKTVRQRIEHWNTHLQNLEI